MRRTKEQKAITLIALIITIVVLLILAAVAISSITNDGILSYAQNATKDYNQAVKNEQDRIQEYLNFLQNGGLGNETDPDLEFMERYVLGEEKTGKSLTTDLSDPQTMGFKDDTSTTDVDESALVTFLNLGTNENNTKTYIYAKYNNKAYRIVTDTTYITEDVEVCYIPQGREGDVIEGGTYDGWIILTDRDGLVEIVSPDVAKDEEGNVLKLTLGSGDTRVTATTDLNDDDTVDGKDIAILSYNNAITTINNYCKEVMNMENVRSVGGTNNAAPAYHSTNYDNWGASIKVDVASGDMQHEEDLVKLSYFGITATGTNQYWLASRDVYENSGSVNFRVRVVDGGVLGGYNLWYVYSGGAVIHIPSYAVRPVVINPSGI